MPISKSEEGYEGTFNVHEHGAEVVVTGKTRAVVEWKLRKEFADRLEKLAHTAALLKRLAGDVDWYEQTEDSVISGKIPGMFGELAEGLRELRDSEPALMLCADQNEKSELFADDGRILKVDYGDWTDSASALEDRVRRAGHDACTNGAATKALAALFDAGVTGPHVADTADYLTGFFSREFFDKCDDKEAAVAAHVETIVEVSRLACWKAYTSEANGYWPLLTTYRERMKDALATPSERRERALMARAEPEKKRTTVANKATKRTTKRRAA